MSHLVDESVDDIIALNARYASNARVEQQMLFAVHVLEQHLSPFECHVTCPNVHLRTVGHVLRHFSPSIAEYGIS